VQGEAPAHQLRPEQTGLAPPPAASPRETNESEHIAPCSAKPDGKEPSALRQVIYCCQIGTGSLTIRCKIAGVGVDAVVDTGASATIIIPVVLNSSVDGWDEIHRLQNHSLQLATGATTPIMGVVS